MSTPTGRLSAEQRADRLKERVYITVTALAVGALRCARGSGRRGRSGRWPSL